jgi:hypothetical protein
MNHSPSLVRTRWRTENPHSIERISGIACRDYLAMNQIYPTSRWSFNYNYSRWRLFSGSNATFS